MATTPSAIALVLFTIALVCVPAMEDQHAGAVSLGESAAVEPLLGEPAQGGYDEIKGFMHTGLKSRKSKFLTSAECQGSCDADAKCESFSYNPIKHDCIASESSIKFNPNFKYYSRQPWLHKEHIDDDDGTNSGDALGRYTVFTGLMYPEKARFSERFFITLDKCKDLCDADAPASVESNQRLAKFDHTFKYADDGCSAFAYSKEEQRCLLKGVPISYNPRFNYYGKRSAMVESDSTKGPEELENDAKLANEVAAQKKSSDAAEKADASATKQSAKNQENKVQDSVVDEQKKINKQAKKAAQSQVSSARHQEEEQAAVADPKPDRKTMKERKLKESTEKELEKEIMLEAQDRRDADTRAREQASKAQVEENKEVGKKMQAKTHEAAAKAKSARLKGDMNSLIFEFIDRAVLLANNERDLKAAIQRGREHNTKESIVKAKVLSARSERREKGTVYDAAMVAEKSVEAESAADKDAKVVAIEEAKQSAAKNAVTVETSKLKELQVTKDAAEKKLELAKEAVQKLNFQIQSAGASANAEMTQKLQQEETKKGTAETAASVAKKEYTAQELIVKEKKSKVKTFNPEIEEAQQAENVAKAKIDMAKENVRYEFYGDKPGKPTDEEAYLYRKYSKEYGLPLPEDPIPPVPAPPPALTDAPDEPKAALGRP